MKEGFSDCTTSSTAHSPERGKTNEVTSLMAPVYCLERVSKPQLRERGTQTKPCCLHCVEESESLRRSRSGRVPERRKQRAEDRAVELHGSKEDSS